MMIKFEYLTDPIKLRDGVQFLVIENKPLYRRVIEAFHNDTVRELFVLSENYVPLDMKKTLCYIGDIIKLLSFKPRLDADSALENTIRFMKIWRKYLGVKLFAISGLCCFFSHDELSVLHRELSAENICALDIGSAVPNDVNPVNIYIIDKDLCEVIDK